MAQELSAATIAARRFGYGPALAPRGEADAAALLAGLTGPDRMQEAFPVPGQVETLDVARRYLDHRKARKEASPEGEIARAAETALRQMRDRALQAALARILTSETPLRERLVHFWTDHFTTRSRADWQRGLPGAMVEDAIRPHLSGPFSQMLRAAVTHPAMVIYLDQSSSIGPGSPGGLARNKGLNENLAREVLELHTLGADGGYSQTDVREFAELLTGLTFERARGVVFKPKLAEPGDETVLGIRYGGRRGRAVLSAIERALDDLALHPATARHLARKLAVHFISDQPPEALVKKMAAAYLERGGRLDALYAVLLAAPEAWAADFPKLRQPFEFIAAGLGALGMTAERLFDLRDSRFRALVQAPLARMGQPFQAPPGPDGWPEETAHWLTPQAMAERMRWAMAAPQAVSGAALPDLSGFVVRALGSTDPPLAAIAGRAETRAEALGLVLAAPAFHRR